MRKTRTLETKEQRKTRLEHEAHRRSEESAAADAAVDAMIKTSIRLYGA